MVFLVITIDYRFLHVCLFARLFSIQVKVKSKQVNRKPKPYLVCFFVLVNYRHININIICIYIYLCIYIYNCLSDVLDVISPVFKGINKCLCNITGKIDQGKQNKHVKYVCYLYVLLSYKLT